MPRLVGVVVVEPEVLRRAAERELRGLDALPHAHDDVGERGRPRERALALAARLEVRLQARDLEEVALRRAAVARDLLDVVRLVDDGDGVFEVLLDADGAADARVHEVLVGAEDDVAPLRQRARGVVRAAPRVLRVPVAPRELPEVRDVDDAREVLDVARAAAFSGRGRAAAARPRRVERRRGAGRRERAVVRAADRRLARRLRGRPDPALGSRSGPERRRRNFSELFRTTPGSDAAHNEGRHRRRAVPARRGA